MMDQTHEVQITANKETQSKRTFRVLEIFGEPINKGGQQSFVLYALENMDLSNITVDLFTPYYANNLQLIGFIKAHGGKVIANDLPFIPGKSRRNIIPVLKDALQREKYDAVHIHSGSITALAYSAREAYRAGVKKIIVHSHSSGESGSIKHDLIKLYSAPILSKNATHYCACSNEAAEWEFPRNVWKKVQIINNGIDPDHFAYDVYKRKEMRKKYEIENETVVLGHVGRFSREKNQGFLVELLKNYLAKHPDERIKLLLMGEGDNKQDAKKKAHRYGLDEYIAFPEDYDKVAEFMQMIDIFLVPSLYEGLSLVALEAQASGLPVIASNGLPQRVKVTDNMEFIALDNINAWCEAIEKHKSDKRIDNRSIIKKAGFDIKDTARAIQEIYISG